MKLLLLTQLIINNKISVTTKQSPFRTNHGMDPNVRQMLKKGLQNTMEL